MTFNWYHIALRYDGTAANPRCTLYVNGVLDRTANDAAASIPNNASNLTIGLLNSGDTRYLDGIIDELSIYTRAMREEEIQASYRRGVQRLGLDPYQDFRSVAYWTQRFITLWKSA